MILEATGINKSYPGVIALKDVDFRISAGEIVAVVGENGAGKSTLMRVLAGAVRPDSGNISMNGKFVDLKGPLDAQSQGICTIYQELMIVPDLSVVENVFLGHLKQRRGLLDWAGMRKEASEILSRLGLKASLDAKAGDLGIAEQQLIEIAKSLSRNSKVLIMDEPTAALSKEEVANLFSLVRSLRNDGIAVVLITHHLHEIFEICDRLIVLRDGENVGDARIDEIDEGTLVSMMLGRSVDVLKSRHRDLPQNQTIVLEVRGLTRLPVLDNVDLELRKGEVLGIAGLMGAGRTELLRALFGADRIDSGEITVRGSVALLTAPRIALDIGIGLAPEDRKTQGLILSMPIGHNVTLPSLARFSSILGIDLRKEERAAADLCRKLFVKYSSLDSSVGNLSGGNQQKVVLAKLLGAGTEIYLLDEPTRGIDIGAKEAIFDLIWTLTDQGASVIIVSSVIEELVRVCDRIVCLHLGKVTEKYLRDEFSLNRIMLSAMGRSEKRGSQQ